jgi:hypothetical protein
MYEQLDIIGGLEVDHTYYNIEYYDMKINEWYTIRTDLPVPSANTITAAFMDGLLCVAASKSHVWALSWDDTIQLFMKLKPDKPSTAMTQGEWSMVSTLVGQQVGWHRLPELPDYVLAPSSVVV